MTILMIPDMANFARNVHGGTSVEIGAKAVTDDIQKKLMRHPNSCYFTMVAVDADRKPIPMPPFKPTTEEERHRYAAAEQRKALHQQFEIVRAALSV